MKKLLFIGALVLSSGIAFSQTKGDGKPDRPKGKVENKEEHAKAFKDKMAKELNLTESQIKQINSVDDKYKAKEEELRAKSESIREQKHQLVKEKRAEIEKILTDEQKQKLTEMKSKAIEKKDKLHDKKK
ncbi:MAG: Spy/CpxP family protein refolding chaperone [Flavobacteriaceae bacterium]|jgi:Spy/CpxP family protein refolding chaperone|nr:Spy/CpxP family protein refolding chaperone [Flavobacteriaceae bacterium]